MISHSEAWRVDVLSQSERLIGIAMAELSDDANQAYWLVHEVMCATLHAPSGPSAGALLDIALDRAARC